MTIYNCKKLTDLESLYEYNMAFNGGGMVLQFVEGKITTSLFTENYA